MDSEVTCAGERFESYQPAVTVEMGRGGHVSASVHVQKQGIAKIAKYVCLRSSKRSNQIRLPEVVKCFNF